MRRTDIALGVLLVALYGVAGVLGLSHMRGTPAASSSSLVHAGIIVSKATETVDGHPHCFVTISAKDTAGKYYKRTDEVNCWLYRNDLRVGSWWQFAD